MRLQRADFVEDTELVWSGNKLKSQDGVYLRCLRKLENHKIYVDQKWKDDNTYYLVDKENSRVYRYTGEEKPAIVELMEAYAERVDRPMKSKEDIEDMLASLDADMKELFENPDRFVDKNVARRQLHEKRTMYTTLLWVLGEMERFD